MRQRSAALDQTPWFLFGAGLIGMMATKSGLARRLAYMVTSTVGAGYSRLLLGLILTSFLSTFLVPSGIACVVIMAAVALGVMDVFGLGRGSNVGRGIFVTLTYTAGTFDKMVIAGASSILGRGLIEKGTNIEVPWSQWFLAFLPCALATIFFTWRLIVWLYPPEKEALEGGAVFLKESLAKMGPWNRDEKRSLLLMLIAIASVVHGFDSPHLSGSHWHRHRSARDRAGIGSLEPRGFEAGELPPGVLHRRRDQHGQRLS